MKEWKECWQSKQSTKVKCAARVWKKKVIVCSVTIPIYAV
jgi:hypothetical protein